MFVAFLYVHIVVPPAYIPFCIYGGTPQVLDESHDKGKGTLILHGPLIDVLVVLHGAEFVVSLIDEENDKV